MRRFEPGRPPLGLIDEPVGPISRGGYALRKPMGGRAGWFARRFGFKHFQYIGAVSDDLFVGCAIADAGLLVNSFAYVFDPRTGAMCKRGWERPLGRGFTYNPDPDEGTSRFLGSRGSVTMSARRETGEKRLHVDLGDDFQIDMSFVDAPPFDTLRLCTQTGATGWTYAQKVAGVPAMGRVRCSLGEFDLQALDAFAHHDFTAGYLRPETNWYWACLSGRAASGEVIGFNLSSGVNESGVTENCLWCNGELIKVDSVLLECDEDDLDQPWAIASHDGAVDLEFKSLGDYRAKRNLRFAGNNFHQLFGRFDGVIRCGEREIVVNEMGGFAERQYLKW
ncbi:MAG: DUF2804 domain-containing protein [Halioglobus sp.]|nr:DUF2804 domain-containing protein [Halioglobus sp.]